MINQTIVMYVVAGVLAVLLIVLVLEFFLLRNKLNRLYRKYMYFMKSAEGGSIEVKISTEVRELREMIASSENMLHQQELLANMQLQSFQKTGLVRYDAFDDTGDKLSFSLTILDGKNNGFILSSLAGHDASRIYAKKVTNGQCREALSAEEAESINLALNTLMPDMAQQAQQAAEAAAESGYTEYTAAPSQTMQDFREPADDYNQPAQNPGQPAPHDHKIDMAKKN